MSDFFEHEELFPEDFEESVAVECVLLSETENAYLFLNGSHEVWVAKSRLTEAPVVVEETFEEGCVVRFALPYWLAQEKGLL